MAPYGEPGKADLEGDVLRQVGGEVRQARVDAGLSRRALAETSHVSERYLALLESGRGNISIGLLARIANALGRPIDSLFAPDSKTATETYRLSALYLAADPERRRAAMTILGGGGGGADRLQRFALIGLRGAGKSTLGQIIADEFDMPFVELSESIRDMAGLPHGEVVAFYGAEGFRELEDRMLRKIVEERERLVLAVSGGIVDSPRAFGFLLNNFHTVWLKARPEEHMARLRRQGDLRPMAGNPNAMRDLQAIMNRRNVLYSRAEAQVDTSDKSIEAAAAEAISMIRQLGALGRDGD